MAYNRMWLVYRPTGDAVCLGRSGGDGWYFSGLLDRNEQAKRFGDAISELFEKAKEGWIFEKGSQNDFAVAIEVVEKDEPFVLKKWKYAERDIKDKSLTRRLLIPEFLSEEEKTEYGFKESA